MLYIKNYFRCNSLVEKEIAFMEQDREATETGLKCNWVTCLNKLLEQWAN